VQGIGPARRLEIDNLGHAIEGLDADIVCLQEVRKMNRQAARHFPRWPVLRKTHEDISDHRFEQRGLLHVPVTWNGTVVHTIVAHFGLIHASRVRQVQRLAEFIARQIPDHEAVIVAGDFNDWGEKLDLPMTDCDLFRAGVPGDPPTRFNTFPSRLPIFSMDRIYTRGFRCRSTSVPRGTAWARMSDHLPLVAELELA
jgi:endonuclease/exonuclease/phosphatase family metal-dependent hydrolase